MADIFKEIKRFFTKLGKLFTSVGEIIKKIKILIKCLMAFFAFISVFFSYCGNFVIWIFIYFFPWVGQYFECILQKIISLPKCFFWYLLECIGWVVYLPFRIVFWFFNMEQFVHDYFWCLLEDADKFLHDSNGLGTGIHIIHFPDSVMDKCYYCHIKPIGKKMPSTCKLSKKYNEFINCNAKNKSDKCGANISQYFDSPNEDKSKSADFGKY
jgi:hypothetical protein